MTALDVLPNRRVEGWRWSDLRAALGETAPKQAGDGPVLARLAAGAGRLERIEVAAGKAHALTMSLGAGALDVQAVDVTVAAGGSFDLVMLQTGGDVALGHARVRLGAGASFRQFILADGARYARIETSVEVMGERAGIETSGVYFVGQGRHADLTSEVRLDAEHPTVRQLVRGVARKGGRGVFQGKFKVERPAQKTDAEMEHNALLLEDGAEVFAKPELEIYADDVACSHGNTCGQLDEQAVFYARSRGLPEAEARAMLTRAFLIEALPDWLDAGVRAEAETRIDAWLRGGHA